MSAESWAKVGYMFLCSGSFLGRRILPYEWVEKSSRNGMATEYINGDFDYGYQMWYSRYGGEHLFNGMLGQNVWICPQNKIVAVIMGGNNELFQDSPALDIIRRHLGGEIDDELHRADYRVLREKQTEFFDSRRWVRPMEKKSGLFYWLGLRPRESFDASWNALLGDYRFGNNNVGMLPLIVRGMQNNLDSSLESVSFYRRENELYLSFSESGVRHTLSVGLYEYKTGVLDFRGERYIVKCMGEAASLADGGVEYRIDILFPELPNTRMLRITRPSADRILLELFELPNDRIVENLLSKLSERNTVTSLSIELMEKRFGDGIVSKTIKRAFCPVLVGADIRCAEYERIIEEENLRAASESRAIKLIRAVVDRFFTDTLDEQGEAETTPQKKNIISGIINRITEKINKNH